MYRQRHKCHYSILQNFGQLKVQVSLNWLKWIRIRVRIRQTYADLTISGSTTLTSTVAKSDLPKNFTQKKNVK
jgi:hypothetical protein